MPNYVDNMYNKLKREGKGVKYEHPGIYCIKIDNKIVYVGKSFNMLRRVSQHYVNIKIPTERKYTILSQAAKEGHAIGFDVLYYAKQNWSSIEQELGEKEREYICKIMPALNTQIPDKDDWHKFTVKEIPEDFNSLSKLL